MPPLHRLIPLALVLASVPAYAQSSAAEAEHTRLTDEMKRLTARNAWKGVDDAYRRMEALSADEGVKLTYRDHWMGAVAARELGDLNAVYSRLQRAAALEKTDEVASWMADLNQNYGQVKLRIDNKYPGDRTLAIGEMPFDPAQRRVIEAAQLALTQTRVYEGILPVGAYTFGDQTFNLESGGGATKEVTLQPKSVRDNSEGGGGGGGGLSYAGPRIDLGVSFTVAGEPTSAPEAQGGGFSGVGGRLGLGWEVGFTTRIGLLAEVGYHSLFAGAPDMSAPDGSATELEYWADPVGSTLHMGYGWLAGAVRLGDLRVAAGPVYGVGVASTMGWADGSDDDGVSYTQRSVAHTQGLIRAGGAELGLFYGFLNMGSLQGGLGFHAGAMTDTGRWYPWGQLAFTLAPAAYRRDG